MLYHNFLFNVSVNILLYIIFYYFNNKITYFYYFIIMQIASLIGLKSRDRQAVSLSRGPSRGQSSSRLIWVVCSIQNVAGIRPRLLFPCCQLRAVPIFWRPPQVLVSGSLSPPLKSAIVNLVPTHQVPLVSCLRIQVIQLETSK